MQVVEDENRMKGSLSTFNLNHTCNLTIAEEKKQLRNCLLLRQLALVVSREAASPQKFVKRALAIFRMDWYQESAHQLNSRLFISCRNCKRIGSQSP